MYQEDFVKAKYGEGIIPFFNDDEVVNNYHLRPFTTKCFPEGGYHPSAAEDPVIIVHTSRPYPCPNSTPAMHDYICIHT